MMLAYDLLLLFHLFKRQFAKDIGLTFKLKNKRSGFLILPFLALPLYNLMSFDIQMVDWSILLIVSCGIAEEIFFRGILLKALLHISRKYGVVISAVIFALCHTINFFTYDANYVALQLLVAFSAGIAYGYIAFYGKSIMPCILLHILTNVTASENNAQYTGLIICSIFYMVYTFVYAFVNKDLVEEKR